MTASRRGALGIGLALAFGYMAVREGLPLIAGFGRELEFAPLDRPAGFRRMAGGATSSGGFDLFVGLSDGPEGAPDPALAHAVEADPCGALFAGWSGDPQVVPIASFSDYNCPICRVTTPRLAGMEAVRDGTAQVTWHELPILGESSLLAARAALAADLQGAYAAFQERLTGNPFRATPAYMRALAAELDLDHDRLVADMRGAPVARRIARSLALRDLFGFAGTPAIVVGRTVVEGDLDGDTLALLIERERADGPPPGCM